MSFLHLEDKKHWSKCWFKLLEKKINMNSPATGRELYLHEEGPTFELPKEFIE